MKLYAPEYYKEFVCIADKCTHSCCIGWEIDIDETAMEKYNNTCHCYKDKLISSIELDQTPHFKLDSHERCPHLNEKGLCEIILNLGEDYLCHICREHPRFYNYSSCGKEVGLGMACEEAGRIILNSDNYNKFIVIGEADEEEFEYDFDSLSHREKIYSVLSDDSVSYEEKLRCIYEEYNTSPFLISDTRWREVLSSLEYLDEAHRKLFCEYTSRTNSSHEHWKYLERALAYFIYRHCTESEDLEEFRINLGFCLFCERLFAYLISKGENDIVTIGRIISEEIEYSEDNTEAIKFQI